MRIHILGLAAALLSVGTAHADVPPLGLQECSSKQAGDACERVGFDGKVQGKGKCVDQTCGKLDYANWDRDASPNAPPSKQYDCRLCTLDADLKSDGGMSADGGVATDEDKDDGGCTLAVSDKTQRRALALSLAAIVALVIRRRQKR